MHDNTNPNKYGTGDNQYPDGLVAIVISSPLKPKKIIDAINDMIKNITFMTIIYQLPPLVDY